VCRNPFVIVADVGCILIFPGSSSMNSSRTHCRALGSDIFVANDLQHISNLWSYIVAENPSANSGYAYWVGIYGDKWTNGRTITEWPTGETPGSNTCGVTRYPGQIEVHPCVVFSPKAAICVRNI
ncbi:hypothetical protein SK128_025253, partial [Halocaridina rubra]